MRGLLLINLGTPDAPTKGAVRRYLREFLGDPKVIDINPIGRALLLNLIILPFRSGKSAQLYQSIWTEEGSPLLVHGQALRTEVAACLDDDWQVELAMRYGKPSISAALQRLTEAGCTSLAVLPLYPQFASSTTGSTLERVSELTDESSPPIHIVPPFYDDEDFVAAFVAVGRPVLDEKKPDHVVYSFHGLPERHVLKDDPSKQHCLQSDSCCDQVAEVNRNCYRAQCYATARGISSALNLEDNSWTVSFQSRLGRTEWIKPYFDELLPTLAEQGHKNLVVFSPAFVADCLETLEEIGIRAREQWKACGGEELSLVPSLNATAPWARCVANLAQRHTPTPD